MVIKAAQLLTNLVFLFFCGGGREEDGSTNRIEWKAKRVGEQQYAGTRTVEKSVEWDRMDVEECSQRASDSDAWWDKMHPLVWKELSYLC